MSRGSFRAHAERRHVSAGACRGQRVAVRMLAQVHKVTKLKVVI